MLGPVYVFPQETTVPYPYIYVHRSAFDRQRIITRATEEVV